ncbi:uncharacterized protein DS421_3g66680 [Arachis hypogaea]|nr:uncharacterized protein DS421_3g66680 [Arachis hypogaea]
MVLGIAQSSPKLLIQLHHTCHVSSHRRNKCLTDSISFLQRTQILSLGIITPSLLNLSLVFTRPTNTNHPKSSILEGTTPRQTELVKL